MSLRDPFNKEPMTKILLVEESDEQRAIREAAEAAEAPAEDAQADSLLSLLGSCVPRIVEIKTVQLGERSEDVPIARLSFKERELINAKRYRRADRQSQPTLDLEHQDTNTTAWTLHMCVMENVGTKAKPEYAKRYTLEGLLGTPEVEGFRSRPRTEAVPGILDDTRPEVEEMIFALLGACYEVNSGINPLFLAAMAQALG